jgi:ABC-2 type transport system permease protein
MRALGAVLHREARIRVTNVTFIFWDLLYPIGYLLVFGVGMDRALAAGLPGLAVDYNRFFLAGVLGMASFGIASNTAWSFFVDRDNGMFQEMLTYPLGRPTYLAGKVLFNVAVALGQALATLALAAVFLDIEIHLSGLPLVLGVTVVGTAGWFFFYAIFALRLRRNDAFNTITSVFYFVFLFASSMFYPVEPLPDVFRTIARLNPITWHVDALRYGTIGLGEPGLITIEVIAFLAFTSVTFALALDALRRQER